MISVIDHIEYLTSEHDCVIIPGFGAFISQYSKSQMMKNGMIEVPQRNVVFNMSVNNNDGLLANSIVRREGVSYDMANTLISDYLCSLRQQLKHEGEVPVGRLGFFSYQDEDVYEFTPFESRCYANEFYGLRPLNFTQLSELNRVDDDVYEERKSNIVPFVKRVTQIAASVMLLLCMAFMLSTPIKIDQSQNYANLNVFEFKEAATTEIANGDLYISMPVQSSANAIAEANTQASDDNTIIAAQEDKPQGNYYLVVASLPNKRLAEKYISETGNSDCKIIASKGGMYRVYTARGSYDEMNKLKASEYSKSDAWVCRN